MQLNKLSKVSRMVIAFWVLYLPLSLITWLGTGDYKYVKLTGIFMIGIVLMLLYLIFNKIILLLSRKKSLVREKKKPSLKGEEIKKIIKEGKSKEDLPSIPPSLTNVLDKNFENTIRDVD